MILLGDLIDAGTAAEIGLVNRVAPAGEAVAIARAMAETIASRGPIAVREAKRVIDIAGDTPLDEGFAAEMDASERIFATQDMLEGAKAFFEKRPPEFTNE
jgi:enoyl-CoA hydratase/carnithine racemase